MDWQLLRYSIFFHYSLFIFNPLLVPLILLTHVYGEPGKYPVFLSNTGYQVLKGQHHPLSILRLRRGLPFYELSRAKPIISEWSLYWEIKIELITTLFSVPDILFSLKTNIKVKVRRQSSRQIQNTTFTFSYIFSCF